MSGHRPSLFGLGVFGVVVLSILSILVSLGVSVAIIYAIIEGVQWLSRH